jgi:hypothetical protein
LSNPQVPRGPTATSERAGCTAHCATQPRDCDHTCFGRDGRRGSLRRTGPGRHVDNPHQSAFPTPRSLRVQRRRRSRESGQAATSRFAVPHRTLRPRPSATTDHSMTAPAHAGCGRLRGSRHRHTYCGRPKALDAGGPDESSDTNGRTGRALGHGRRCRRKRDTNHHATTMTTGHWMWRLASILRDRHSHGSRCRSGRWHSNADGATRRARCQLRRWLGQGCTVLHTLLVRQQVASLVRQQDGFRPR